MKGPSRRIGASLCSASGALIPAALGGGDRLHHPVRVKGRALLQQPRQPPVLEQLALGLAGRAVAHHVVLVEHRLELVAAARARLAVVAVDGERHRQLVGDRQRERWPRSGRSRRPARAPWSRAAARPRPRSRSEPRLNGESIAACRISSTHERPIPAITCWSRSSAYSGRGWSSSSPNGGGSGHASGPSAAIVSSARAPRLRSSLTQARCRVPNSRRRSSRPSVQPHQQPRGPVAQRRPRVEQLQAPGGHQVDHEREVAVELDHEQLAPAPDALERAGPRARSAAGRTS